MTKAECLFYNNNTGLHGQSQLHALPRVGTQVQKDRFVDVVVDTPWNLDRVRGCQFHGGELMDGER